MNVDCDNLHEAREYIRERGLIEKCEFISFDLEFTGVKFDNHERERWDMFLNEKYQKMSLVATKFNIIQVGVTFILPSTPGKYTAYPFNFYVFPRESFLSDPVISMQAGCVEFNTSQNMDWNRWIRKGINFIKISEFNRYLKIDKGKSFKQLYEYLSLENQSIVDQTLSELKEIGGEEKTFELPRLAAYQVKKALEQYSEENELNYVISVPKNSPEDEKVSRITVRALSKKEHLSHQAAHMESIAGFTLIFEEIWNSGKPLIGHNSLYDVLFLYSSFVDNLPSDYLNFKKALAEGRRFYDTKYIATRLEEKNRVFTKGTSLQELYNFYSQQNPEQILSVAQGFQSYDLKNPALHEAGFDSYLTAWVFFHLPHSEELEGVLNSAKSFYCMNLRKESDQIRKDVLVFVVPVAAYNAFVPLDELKKRKIEHIKNIREQLMAEGILNIIAVSDGLKEIFIAAKDYSGNQPLVTVLNKLKQEKRIMNLMSLESWIKVRIDTQTNGHKSAQKNNQ